MVPKERAQALPSRIGTINMVAPIKLLIKHAMTIRVATNMIFADTYLIWISDPVNIFYVRSFTSRWIPG